MLIQDLNHVEIISEETHLQGGAAFASVGTGALAFGSHVAETISNGGGNTYSGKYGWFRQDTASAGGYSRALGIGRYASATSGISAIAIAG